MRERKEIMENIRAGLGEKPCDLVLENVKLVNVYSSEIIHTNIYINKGRILSTHPQTKLKAKKTIDCKGYYAYPGLIDAHMHFESTMLSPEALSNLIVPNGVTAVFADIMEIANVCGEKGIREMLVSSKNLPYHMYTEVSSCVPAAPGLETTGAVMDSKACKSLMDLDQSISLGEIDQFKVLGLREDYIEKIAQTLKKRKIVNGHAIGLVGHDLNIYASAGVMDDHECVTKDEMIERLRTGMSILIREGSSERNLDTMVKAIIEDDLSVENFMFCTDDKHVDDSKNEGHINYNIRKSIKLGLDPIDAIKIATVNAAKHFRLDDEIGSISPGRMADIVISESFDQKMPDMVFYGGKLVAKNGQMIEKIKTRNYPHWIKDTVKLKEKITEKSFHIKSKKENESKVRLIDLIEDQIINKESKAILKVRDGLIQNDLKKDIIKLAVVERYGKNGNIGLGFVRKTGLKEGAIAYSMSHDHHNIVIMGTNDRDMALCTNHIEKIRGGIAIAKDGEIIGEMALPIGGLMSEKDVDQIEKEVDSLNHLAKDLGCVLNSPLMTLSFVSLPTVPDLGLTDKGLIDVKNHKIVELEI